MMKAVMHWTGMGCLLMHVWFAAVSFAFGSIQVPEAATGDWWQYNIQPLFKYLERKSRVLYDNLYFHHIDDSFAKIYTILHCI